MPIVNRDAFIQNAAPLPTLGGSWHFATASAALRGFLNSGARRDCAETVDGAPALVLVDLDSAHCLWRMGPSNSCGICAKSSTMRRPA